MNIFFLSIDPEEAARDMCDPHVVKMTLESTQLLFTCHHLVSTSTEWILRFQSETGKEPYKASHQKHGCQIWLQQGSANYEWLCRHAVAMVAEYKRRYGDKPMSVEPLLQWLQNNVPDNLPRTKQLTEIYLAMPEECKYYWYVESTESYENMLNRTVQSYRLYYLLFKSRFARYYYTKVPYWLEETLFYIQSLSDSDYLSLIPQESPMRKVILKKPPKVPKGIRSRVARKRTKSINADKQITAPIVKDEPYPDVKFRRITRSMTESPLHNLL
ncbi:hypothetical protein GEMRC1_007113 [Eukaryota sp. GEM-RC1]